MERTLSLVVSPFVEEGGGGRGGEEARNRSIRVGGWMGGGGRAR